MNEIRVDCFAYREKCGRADCKALKCPEKTIPCSVGRCKFFKTQAQVNEENIIVRKQKEAKEYEAKYGSEYSLEEEGQNKLRKPWTSIEDKQMLDLYAAEYPVEQIAEILNRSESSITQRKFKIKNKAKQGA